MLEAVQASNLFASLRHALILQAFTVQRSGVVAAVRWSDLDLKRGQWTIRRTALKIKDDERSDLVIALYPAMAAMLKKLPRKSQ